MEQRSTKDLRQQLERLQGRLGTTRSPVRPSQHSKPIEQLVGGDIIETSNGPCVVVDSVYPLDYRHGHVEIGSALSSSPQTLAGIGCDSTLQRLELNRSAFLDVETTGLAGGTGTCAFLVGLGWFKGSSFRIRQLFMRDYSEERALVGLVEEMADAFSGIVSFNGKAFDVPVLEARFAMSRRSFPLSAVPHLDMLSVSRRLWRLRLVNCTLSHLEPRILGVQREDDVPSYVVPSIYFNYLRYGVAGPLKQVFSHNTKDILSLAALTGLACRVFEDPAHFGSEHGEDLYSLGRLYLHVGKRELAEAALRAALDTNISQVPRQEAIFHLSFHYKRQSKWDEAVDLWHRAIRENATSLYPFVELAKYYEHRTKQFHKAEDLVLRATEMVKSSPLKHSVLWQEQCLAELQHRLRRVQRKKARRSTTSLRAH